MGTREVPGLRRAAAIDRELLKTLTDGGSGIVDRGRFGGTIRTTRTHLSRMDAASGRAMSCSARYRNSLAVCR